MLRYKELPKKKYTNEEKSYEDKKFIDGRITFLLRNGSQNISK